MKYEYLLKKILLIFLGFIFSFFLLEFVLQTASFITKIVISAQNKSLESQIANANFKKNKNTLTILCIGESTTYKQWPIQLQMYLNRNKSSVNYQVVDCGIPATNLDLILKNLDMQLKKYNPDIIISMMGINDIPRGNLTYIKHQLKTIELLELLKLHIMFKEPIFNHYDFDGFVKFKKIAEEYYSDFKKPPKKLLDLLKKEPDNLMILANLIILYNDRNDFANTEKYFKIYSNLEHVLSHKFMIIASSICYTYIHQEKYSEALNLISNILSNNNITKFEKNNFINQISGGFINSPDDKLILFYDLLLSYNCSAEAVSTVYQYCQRHNIPVKNKPKKYIPVISFQNEYVQKIYLNFAEKLEEHNITYFCMGYPRIPISQLKNIFKNSDLREKIIFIQNQTNFEKELKNTSYYDLFNDSFAGIFGHCTDKGNELIAINIGKSILSLTD